MGKTLIKIHRYSNLVNKEVCTKHIQITKYNQVIQKEDEQNTFHYLLVQG